MLNLGKMKKITELRDVWKNEPRNFSTWLAEDENLAMLSEQIGVDLELVERESEVGDFSADLLCVERGTDKKIIIENQLGRTDHDHLGKCITYASFNNACRVIWIAKNAREEHRQAVEWLNQHTDGDISFFLIEIELWQIDNSAPAARFNIVEGPNDKAKTIKLKKDKQLGKTQELQLNFWQRFADYAYGNEDFSSQFTQRKPSACHWYTCNISRKPYGFSCLVDTKKKTVSVELYFTKCKDRYEQFMKKKEEMEARLGFSLRGFVADKDCRIVTTISKDIKDESNWTACFDWYIEALLKWKKLVDEFDI